MGAAALLHDIGDNPAIFNHTDIDAAIVKPYVSEKTHWIVQQQGLFQTYYLAMPYEGLDPNARDHLSSQGRDHLWFDACAELLRKIRSK